MHNDQNKSRKIAKGVIRFGKQSLSLAARILVEIIEQQEDLGFLYFHSVRDGQSVREARYGRERYLDHCLDRKKKQAINRLKQRKYIELGKDGNRVVAALTSDGKIKALQILIRSSKDNYADGKTILVSYDFP